MNTVDKECAHNEWILCGKSIGLSNVLIDEIWTIIAKAYEEPHRKYHTLTHIADMLKKLNEVLHDSINDFNAVRLAIYFHDIVYDPSSTSNEEQSSNLFVELLQHNLDSPSVNKIASYILSTKSHNVSSDCADNDMKCFLDLDMSIMGSDWENYLLYARQVRQEYLIFADDVYCKGRIKVLESFLSSPHIFATELMRSRYEPTARNNIQREKRHLETIGLL